ncbi:MAG: hypothetical protein WCD18_08315 [Thermosynechococcaceae cyanobacterium]
MKKFATVFGTSLFVVSGTLLPLQAMAYPKTAEPSGTSAPVFSGRSATMAERMAIYEDCVRSNANIRDADFKTVNKFCSCVSDQTIQGNNGGLSNCASGGDSGSTLGIIGEVAPSVIMGVVQGLATRQSTTSDGSSGGILDKLGGLLGGGGLLGDGGGLLGGSGGFNIKDLLKNRL